MKVCFVIESMFNSGGMENVLSCCASALSSDIDVSILTLYQNKQKYFFPLSENIRCYDLSLNDIRDKRVLQKKIKSFFLVHQFDIVVSLGGIDMYYLHSIKDGSKKVVWFHFAHNVAYTAWLGDSSSFIKKIKGYLLQAKRIYNARKYDTIVAISSADKKAWKKYTRNVVLIHNPLTISHPVVSQRKTKTVVSVGRLDFAKGFDLLINAWKLVSKQHSDWILNIYGDGELREPLQEQINKLNLSDTIILQGRKSNIGEIYSQHSFYVMSSRSEALGLVLIEAAACGLPLIAYDCPFGPKDIIKDGKNGFLVKKVGDIEGMAEAINKLIENQELRDKMGEKALLMVDRFSLSKITIQWHNLFKTLASM